MNDKTRKKTLAATELPYRNVKIMLLERGSTRWHCLENRLWKMMWTCRKADHLMVNNLFECRSVYLRACMLLVPLAACERHMFPKRCGYPWDIRHVLYSTGTELTEFKQITSRIQIAYM